jgi:hypothetical protein
MLTKVFMSAAAAALISTAASAQQVSSPDPAHDLDPQTTPISPSTDNPNPLLGNTRESQPRPSSPQSSATNPSTVNPPADVESRVSVDPHAGLAAAPAPTGSASDVAATSPDAARAAGAPVETVASAPVPDTAENRSRYGAPLSRAGKMTQAAGN